MLIKEAIKLNKQIEQHEIPVNVSDVAAIAELVLLILRFFKLLFAWSKKSKMKVDTAITVMSKQLPKPLYTVGIDLITDETTDTNQ
tara:strand:+ start:442 stop:699 length:258 start_codon:yes stop_codon:yes gene_type:complete